MKLDRQDPNILQLYLSRYKETMRDTFDSGLEGWKEGSSDWHKMTVDTNVDQSSGLTGGLALDTAGCYEGGRMRKTVELDTWGEIIFEHYVQNPDPEESENELIFRIDGVDRLVVKGPSPWQRCQAIGLSPGEHELEFEYNVDEQLYRKAVIDTIVITEGRKIDCIIGEYTPPKPVRNLQVHNILRGHNRIQQMKESDTEVRFQAMFFNPTAYQDFVIHQDDMFYFIDEFSKCYRGTFPEDLNPESIAVGTMYSVDMRMLAPQKVGKGFC